MRRTLEVKIHTPAQPAVGESFNAKGKKVPGKPGIPAGRDNGKLFIITEMPATTAERWATRALELLEQAGATNVDLEGGMAALAATTAKGLRSLKALQDPSLDAWWDCVQYQHDPSQMPKKIIQGDGCQIEEISTITLLRTKVLELHLSFFTQGGN